MKKRTMTASMLLLAAGMAHAQPTIDGRLTPGDASFYGAAKWIQTNPTAFGDNNAGSQPPCAGFGGGIRIAIDNSNVAGVTGGTGPSSGAGVTTGVEIAIPLSQLGNPTGAIRIAGFINGGGHDFLSNQVIGSLPDGFGNLGEPRNVDFSAYDGDQFVTVPAPGMCLLSTPPVMDGQADAVYGAPLWVQTLQTQFGDSNLGQIDYANGSEIDALYGFVCNADIGNGVEPVLFILVAGNLESNFNKLDLFFDVAPGGQNQLRGDNPNVDFNGLNRMGDNGGGNGLKFDAGFESDYYLTFTCGGGPFATYANYAETLTSGGGQGAYIGSGGAGTDFLQAEACPPSLPDAGLSYGSEVNAVYSYLDVPNNRLYVMIPGNLKSSDEQHRLHLFFDVNGNPDGDEGQNTMRGNNVILGLADGTAGVINRLGDNGIDPGLTFDAGFYADYYMVFHFEEANGSRAVLDAATLRTNGRAGSLSAALDYGMFQGKAAGTLINTDGSNFCCTPANGIQQQTGILPAIYTAFAPRESGDVLAAYIDLFGTSEAEWNDYIANPATGPRSGLILAVARNDNLVGVTDTSAAGASGATDGIEFSIDLDELGWDGSSPIRLAGIIGNSDTTFMSNQVLGGLPTGAGNLGEPRVIDFSQIAGDQFVVLTGGGAPPCPADWDGNTIVEVADIFAFLSDWFAGDPDATNFGGTPGVPAIFAFLGAWFAHGVGPC